MEDGVQMEKIPRAYTTLITDREKALQLHVSFTTYRNAQYENCNYRIIKNKIFISTEEKINIWS
jgi:hypothetical protein